MSTRVQSIGSPKLIKNKKLKCLAQKIHTFGVVAHSGLSHCSSHLGLGQVVGFLHFQSHLVSSHTGLQRGSGATHLVWHLAGEHTVSHLAHPSISHMSLGQRTEQMGRSQWIVHLAHGVCDFKWREAVCMSSKLCRNGKADKCQKNIPLRTTLRIWGARKLGGKRQGRTDHRTATCTPDGTVVRNCISFGRKTSGKRWNTCALMLTFAARHPMATKTSEAAWKCSMWERAGHGGLGFEFFKLSTFKTSKQPADFFSTDFFGEARF